MNPLYKLIEERKEFMKEDFILFLKTSLSNKNYYMLVPRSRDRSKIPTENGTLTAVGYHITVYEEVRKEVHDSTFHITISLIDENKQSYVARIYYNKYGTYLFNTIKDKEGHFVDIGNIDKLLEFADSSIGPFVEKILNLKDEFDQQYHILKQNLEQLSSELVNIDSGLLRPTLLEYKQELQAMISHIQSNTLLNQKYLSVLRFYSDSLKNTEQRLSEIKVKKIDAVPVVGDGTQSEDRAAVESPQPESVLKISKALSSTTKSARKKGAIAGIDREQITVLNQKIAAVLLLKEIDPINKVLQEYELQKQKLTLLNKTNGKNTRKSSGAKNEDDILDTTIRCNRLSEDINKLVVEVFNDEVAYKAIDTQSMKLLLQQCTLKTERLVELTVSNNCLLALKLLMQIRKDIKLEAKVHNGKPSLLEIAYNNDHLDMFKFLLEHKVSPNIVCANEQPILFTACADGRAKEMEALLEAKANPLAVDPKGFAPLGALLMRTDQKPIHTPMAKVLLTYAPHAMEQMQGRKGNECTALAYACQQDMWEAVELLLRFGADPNKPRSDGHTSFGVCVYKDNFELFKYVVENSTVPIREGLSNALDMAVVCEKKHFIDYIMDYSKEHQLNLLMPEADEAMRRFDKFKQPSPVVAPMGNNISSFFFHNLLNADSDEEDLSFVVVMSK